MNERRKEKVQEQQKQTKFNINGKSLIRFYWIHNFVCYVCTYNIQHSSFVYILAVFRLYLFSCFRSHGCFVMDILSLQCANKSIFPLYNIVIYLLIRVGINEKVNFNGHIISSLHMMMRHLKIKHQGILMIFYIPSHTHTHSHISMVLFIPLN